MIKIKDSVDLKWLMYAYSLRYTNHCDEQGQYIFYSDTFYINPEDRIIHIEGRNPKDLVFLCELTKANLVEVLYKC